MSGTMSAMSLVRLVSRLRAFWLGTYRSRLAVSLICARVSSETRASRVLSTSETVVTETPTSFEMSRMVVRCALAPPTAARCVQTYHQYRERLMTRCVQTYHQYRERLMINEWNRGIPMPMRLLWEHE